jgi:ABC-2 type transport system permease protein
MTGLIRAEWLALRSTRTAAVVALVVLALGMLSLLVSALVPDAPSRDDALSALTSAPTDLFVVILALVATTGDYRHGTITPILLVTPDRARGLIAKALATVLVGLAFGVLAWLVVLAVGLPILAGRDAPLPGTGELAGLMLRGLLAASLWGVLAVGVGALIKHQAGAIVATFLGLFLVVPLLAAVAPVVEDYSPIGAGAAIISELGGDALPVWAAALVLAGWALAALAAGLLATRRRDVT